MNDSHHKELITVAKGIIVNHKSSLSPSDLVNQAYLQLHTYAYNFDTYKKYMVQYCLKDGRQSNFVSLENIGVKFSVDKETNQICSCCNELMPIANFYQEKKGAALVMSRQCNECVNMKRRKRYVKKGRYTLTKMRITHTHFNEQLSVEMEKARAIINSIRKRA